MEPDEYVRRLRQEFNFDYEELPTILDTWSNLSVAVVFSMYNHYYPNRDMNFSPKDLYVVLKSAVTWKQVFEYLGMVNYFRRCGIVDENDLYTIDPLIIAKYFLYPGDPNATFETMSNSNGFYFVSIDDPVTGTIVIQDQVHGEKFDAYEDPDDPRYDILNRFVIPSNGELFRIVIEVVTGVKRIFPGIAQDDAYGTWNNDLYSSDSFYGNTVLLHLRDETYMVIEGGFTYEFQIPKGEVIHSYYSFMANNTIPCPIALSANFVYNLEDFPPSYVHLRWFPSDTDWKNVGSMTNHFKSNKIIISGMRQLEAVEHEQKRISIYDQ